MKQFFWKLGNGTYTFHKCSIQAYNFTSITTKEAVGFRFRSSGFSTPNLWVFGVERMVLQLRRCSASAKNIRTFLSKHIDVSVETYDRLAPTIYMISS